MFKGNNKITFIKCNGIIIGGRGLATNRLLPLLYISLNKIKITHFWISHVPFAIIAKHALFRQNVLKSNMSKHLRLLDTYGI